MRFAVERRFPQTHYLCEAVGNRHHPRGHERKALHHNCQCGCISACRKAVQYDIAYRTSGFSPAPYTRRNIRVKFRGRRWTDLIGERTRRCPHRQSQLAADPASQPGTPKQHRTPLNLHTSSSSRLNMAKRKDFCLERRHHTCTMYCRAAPCLTVVLRKKTLLLRLKRQGPRGRWFECHFGNWCLNRRAASYNLANTSRSLQM
jgi:hypothetical protein